MKNLRRLVAALVVAAFTLAALGGIAVLLRGGDISDTEGKVLLTTVIVGVEALAMLCYLATANTRSWFVGLGGAVISLAAFGWALAMVWGYEPADDHWEWFFSLVIAAASAAQVSLLLGLAGRFRVLVGITVNLIAAVAAMAIYALLQGVNDDMYFRVLGILGILDALGTVVAIAAVAVRGRDPKTVEDSEAAEEKVATPSASERLARMAGQTRPADDDAPLGTWSLTPANEKRLIEVAHANGLSPNEFVEKVLEVFASDTPGDRKL